jgi:hypothetical protein
MPHIYIVLRTRQTHLIQTRNFQCFLLNIFCAALGHHHHHHYNIYCLGSVVLNLVTCWTSEASLAPITHKNRLYSNALRVIKLNAINAQYYNVKYSCFLPDMHSFH